MFIVTLVFEYFGENIIKVFWGCLFLTSEEEWQFYWWVGWSNDPTLEDKCEVKAKSDLAKIIFTCS